MNRRELAEWGEKQAARHLGSRGYRLIARNYRCRFGEIDLVGIDGDATAFVEVKTRRSRRFGAAVEAVGPAKQRRIIAAARHFCQGRRRGRPLPAQLRFDVVTVRLAGEGAAAPSTDLRLIKDAFRP